MHRLTLQPIKEIFNSGDWKLLLHSDLVQGIEVDKCAASAVLPLARTRS